MGGGGGFEMAYNPIPQC